MCQCGCSEFHKRLTLPGPPGIIYLIEIANGCVDCGTPAGVFVQSRPSDSAGDEIDGEIRLRAVNSSNTIRECAIPIANPGAIVDLVRSKISAGFGVSDWVYWPDDFLLDPDELELDVYRSVSETASAFDCFDAPEAKGKHG